MSSYVLIDYAAPASETLASLVRGRWRIDPIRSSVEFRTATLWGLMTVKGRFTRYEGSLDLERDPAVEFIVDASSLDTNNGLRDRHLRSRDFFDVENHPQLGFLSESVSVDEDRLGVTGRLYVAGASLPLELNVDAHRVGDELQLDTTTSVEHRSLGMTHSRLGMIRPHTELIVHARLVQDAD